MERSCILNGYAFAIYCDDSVCISSAGTVFGDRLFTHRLRACFEFWLKHLEFVYPKLKQIVVLANFENAKECV